MSLRTLQPRNHRGPCPFDERGAVGGIEGLAFGVLIFAIGTFVVMNTWAVVDGTMATSAAAREATRAYVEAGSSRNGQTDAVDAAEQAMAGHNHLSTSVLITPNGNLNRCTPITATVTAEVPRIALPMIGVKGGMVKVRSTHTEVVDPYRSGLSGTATCTSP
jgi:hypothetical protein